MSDNITREPYRNAWYKQLSDAVKKHDEEIAEITPHLVPDVEEGDNGKILIAGEEGAFDWGQPPEELPIITESDEGKVLKVDEGVPKWLDDTDSEYLLVTVSRTGSSPNWTYVADKTYAQIRPFAEAGKCIVKYSRTNIFFVLHAVTTTSIMFIHPTEFHKRVIEQVSASATDSRAEYGRVEGMTFTENGISFNDDFMYFEYGFAISNGETISERNYTSIKEIENHITTVVEYEYNSKKVNLILSSRNLANTEFDFVNYEIGIKAHIDANKFVTITQIPKLPTATSADEGKVVMVDSNGDYVLGTVQASSPIPYAGSNSNNIATVTSVEVN